MKRIFLIGLLIASALLTFVACGDETVVTNKPENAKTTLSFTIQGAKPTTRASQTGKVVATPALDREKSITKLYLAAFTSGKFHKVLPAVQKSGANYEVSGVGEGSYDCYLVANPDEALINKLNALTTSSTVDDFDAIVTTQTAGEDNKATNFLMTSQKTSVTIVKNKTTDAGTIKLVRVAARFDIYNTIADLNMTKVTFKNRYVNSRLNRGSANTNMGSELKKNSDKTYEKAQGLLPKECIGCIYGYENMTVGYTRLTLEATYNGKQIKPFDIVIEDIPVKRNHMYSVIISPKGSVIDPNDVFGSLDFNIKVNDWNETTTLSIPSNDLVETSVADFTVSGTYVQGSPLTNPTEVFVTKASATELEVKVTSKGTAAKLTPMSANGYTVIGGEAKVVDGKLEQIYTIKLAANTTGAVREFDFVLANGLKEDAKKVFKVKQKEKQNRPKMAIEYVAEYNIGTTSGVFASSHKNDQSGYYSWDESKAMTMPTGYHLPSADEWRGIVPEQSLRFDATTSTDNYSERVSINGITRVYTADSRSNGNGICYALRFKGYGNTMLAAYRYERVGNFNEGDLNSHLKVTARYLGDSFTGSIADIEKEAYWKSDNDDDVSRIIPNAGMAMKNAAGEWKPNGQGLYGRYWSSTETPSLNPGWYSSYVLAYDYMYLKTVNSNGRKSIHSAIRPFAD